MGAGLLPRASERADPGRSEVRDPLRDVPPHELTLGTPLFLMGVPESEATRTGSRRI